MKLKLLDPWKKRYDKPWQHIKKQRHYFADKWLLVKAMVFSVVMFGCESWTIKKAEHQRIDTLEQWCWRRLLRVPWTARRSNQSILKEINHEYSEVLLLKVKLQYFGHIMQRASSLKKDPGPGKERLKTKGEGGSRRWDAYVASLTHGHEFEHTLEDSEQRNLMC